MIERQCPYAFGSHAHKNQDGSVFVDYVPENAADWSVGDDHTGTVCIYPDDRVVLVKSFGPKPVIDATFVARCRETANDAQ